MTKQVSWTKLIIEEFSRQALLSNDEEFILRTRASGWTITKQADALHMSPDNVSKIVARLKIKYDKAQKENIILPPRKKSAKETYMDTH